MTPPGKDIELEEPVRRVLATLDAMSRAEDRSVAELASELAVPPRTAGDIVGLLERWGAVERTSGERWRLGWKVAELGSLAWAALLGDTRPT